MKNVFLGIMSFILVVSIASCNKDQRAVKKLSGEWTLVKVAGFAVDASGEETQTMNFNECKLKDDEYCSVTITSGDGAETSQYKVTNDGETLVYKDEDGDEDQFTIVTLEKEKLVLKMNLEGQLVDFEFSKN